MNRIKKQRIFIRHNLHYYLLPDPPGVSCARDNSLKYRKRSVELFYIFKR